MLGTKPMTDREARDRENYLKRQPYSRSWFTRGYFHKKQNAQRRGIDFNLTRSDYVALFEQKSCRYCGLPLTTPITIDRIDNDLGYVVGNMVLSCHQCNNLKKYHSLETYEKIKPLLKQRLEINNKIKALLSAGN